MNIALILAGGSGARIATEIPKQFIEICGKTILEHTLDVFERHSLIDEIAIVINAQHSTEIEKILQNDNFKKVKKIASGGAERYDSSWAAIKAYQTYPDANLIIHDAVRPMIDAEIITKVITALEKYNAVSVAIPTTDTIYYVEDNHIQQIPDRKKMMQAQTPQAFKQHLIFKAYQAAFCQKDFSATDDCGIVAKFLPNEPIFVVTGSTRNLKITHREDLCVLSELLKLNFVTQ
ncbi:MAG: 2-C-methyl-D-erythritol 4-phosphate cytidylyltransferase [Lentimicrobiaceae bacterium]|nr:2-C-methyl-D-erythritol 4-phosphate cytidylyltransferase [Lentimicrobiaceae bacterium]